MRSLSRRCVNRVIAPEGEILSFAPPKESIQRKGGSIAAASCAPRFCRGSVERASLPSYRRTASMPRPFGLIPTKSAVFGAANEGKTIYFKRVGVANPDRHLGCRSQCRDNANLLVEITITTSGT